MFLRFLSNFINLSCRFELWAALVASRLLILAHICPPRLCVPIRLDILPLFPLIPRKIHNEFAGGSVVEFYRALLQCMSSSSYHRHRHRPLEGREQQGQLRAALPRLIPGSGGSCCPGGLRTRPVPFLFLLAIVWRE